MKEDEDYMPKKLTSITPSRAVVGDILGVLDAIEMRDNKEGFSAGELAAARKKLVELVGELKPYTSRITIHSLWTIRETLKDADKWLSENPDKNMGFCREYSGCPNACVVQTHFVAIDITTTDDRKEIIFGDFHGQHGRRMVCLDPANPTNPSIEPPPTVDSPPAQEVKPAASAQAAKPAVETDPKRQRVTGLLSQGLKALQAGDLKQAKKFFLDAQKADPSNPLIEKYIERCDEK